MPTEDVMDSIIESTRVLVLQGVTTLLQPLTEPQRETFLIEWQANLRYAFKVMKEANRRLNG